MMKFIKKLFFIIIFFANQLLLSETISTGVKRMGKGLGKKHNYTFFEFLFKTKFILMLIIALVVLVLLVKKKMKPQVKILLLLVSTFLFGVIQNIPGKFFSSFAIHPSPMCAATKPLLYGFRIPFIITLFVIFLLTLIGPKLFCSYICPIGAVQELITMMSNKLKIKRYKINFRVAHGIRLGLFIIFIFISATAILHIMNQQGRIIPKSIYDYVNAFHGFEFEINTTLIENLFHYLPFIFTVILAFKIYRPFCHYICPMGIYAHCLEQISLFRITFKKNLCTNCNICVKKSPCSAVEDILRDATLRPDCYACNVCVDTCPENALKIGVKKTISF